MSDNQEKKLIKLTVTRCGNGPGFFLSTAKCKKKDIFVVFTFFLPSTYLLFCDRGIKNSMHNVKKMGLCLWYWQNPFYNIFKHHDMDPVT